MGASSRSMSTWDPMVESLSGRLNSWGHKYISFRGRVVLLNSVLNSIPIFYVIFEDSGASLEEDSSDSKRIFMGRCGRG